MYPAIDPARLGLVDLSKTGNLIVLQSIVFRIYVRQCLLICVAILCAIAILLVQPSDSLGPFLVNLDKPLLTLILLRPLANTIDLSLDLLVLRVDKLLRGLV